MLIALILEIHHIYLVFCTFLSCSMVPTQLFMLILLCWCICYRLECKYKLGKIERCRKVVQREV